MLVHFARKADWEEAQESKSYSTPDLEETGFIRALTPAQAAEHANAELAGEDDVVLLWIKEPELRAAIVHKRPDGQELGDLYPHIYGPINTDAVARAVELEPWAPGGFVLPKEPSV
ncbi:MAG TPA: DUF952 domain-containing protein [Gaiellaceae bacterium]|jgi:uncharacterized protein (DUF952 family)